MRSVSHFLLLVLTLFSLVLAGCPTGDDDDSAGDDDDATDDDDAADDDDSTAVDFGEPPTATVDLLPDSPGPQDLLFADVRTEDPEGMAVSVTLRWTADGTPVPAFDDASFVPASATAPGQEWAVTVRPNDGGQDGADASDSVTIGNSAPVLFAVSITPLSPSAGDDVVATPGGTLDTDGDAVTVAYEWLVNGSAVPETSATLTSTDFGKGDTVQVVATPNDGTQDGGSVSSNIVTAVNTAPTATGATADPAAGAEDTTFTCAGEGFADADGDTEAWLYTWTVNGIFEIDGATVDGAFFNRGDYLVCTAWPDDGEATGAAVTTTPIQVSNSAPSISSVGINPAPATSSDLLTAIVNGEQDIDGDGVTFSYAWTADGTPVGGDSVLLDPSEFVRGELVTVSVTPTDGTDAGAAVAAAGVNIGNSPPSFDGVTLEYDFSTGVYTAVPSGWLDADGDDEDYDYAWADGSGALSATGATLDSSVLTAPTTLTVTLTAKDNFADGNTHSSAAVEFGPIGAVVPPRADFGVVSLGCEIDGRITVSNTGSSALTVSSLTLTETLGTGLSSIADAPTTPFAVGPGGSVAIDLLYSGLTEEEGAADLEIVTDDPVNPTWVVPVTGSVAPEAEVFDVFYGDWDELPYELAFVPAIIPTEIEHAYSSYTDFTYDPSSNSIDFSATIGSGEVTKVTYVPIPVSCRSNLAPIVVAELVPASPLACVATEIDLSGSYDPEGDAFDYGFEFDSVPASSSLTGDSVAQGGDLAWLLTDADGDYSLAVDATDEQGATSASTVVEFSGLAASGGGLNPPTADAGDDVAGVGVSRCYPGAYGALDCTPCEAPAVFLDGSASSDPDGTALTHTWSVLSGDLVIVDGGDSSSPRVGLDEASAVVASESTVYSGLIELTVTDCDGGTSTDEVTVSYVCTASSVAVGVPIQD